MSQQPIATHPGPQPVIPEGHAGQPDPRCTYLAECLARCARPVGHDEDHWHCTLNGKPAPGDALP